MECLFSGRQLSGAFALSAVLLLLGACSTGPSDSLTETPADSTMIGNAKSLQAIPYQTLIGTAGLKRVDAYEQNGYQIESNQVIVPNAMPGVLVTVQSADGSTFAFVDTPDKKGVWRIDASGKAQFIEDLPFNEIQDDTLPGLELPASGEPASKATNYVVDVLMGYSRKAAQGVGDPMAHALSQVAYVNTLLSNSRVQGVQLKLAGVQILDNDFPITGASLAKGSTIFRQGLQAASADILGMWSGWDIAGLYGVAYRPGRYSLQTIHTSRTFAHEVGHNIGGRHCEAGQPAGYNFGYNNGKSTTSLCGYSVSYYSNPDVRDQHGLPLGNATTANMARVWRENAATMASYAPSLPGSRLILASVNANASATLTIPTRGADHTAGVVVVDDVTEGPRVLEAQPSGYARLVAKMTDKFGIERDVVLRGERTTPCSTRPMQTYVGCGSSQASINLKISLFEEDNPQLVGGMLSGKMQLRALDRNAPTWSNDVTVLLSLNRPAKAGINLDNTAHSGDVSAATLIPTQNEGNSLGIVAMDSTEGPTALTFSPNEGYAIITPTLIDANGGQHQIRFRAQRNVMNCRLMPMNSAAPCINSSSRVTFTVSYVRTDNPTLPAGTYQGNMQFAGKKLGGSWTAPMHVNFKIKR